MVSAKSIFLFYNVIVLFTVTSAGLLHYFYPSIHQEKYNFEPTKDGYHLLLEEPDGSKREEYGVIQNAGTADEELVVMGMYIVHDEKSDIDTITMYTADKDGYRSNYKLKNRKLSASALKSAAG